MPDESKLYNYNDFIVLHLTVLQSYIQTAKYKRSIITRQLAASMKKKGKAVWDELDDQLMVSLFKSCVV